MSKAVLCAEWLIQRKSCLALHTTHGSKISVKRNQPNKMDCQRLLR